MMVRSLFHRIYSKSTILSISLSVFFVAICFAILIFRIAYPYHRILAVSLYLASWIFYIFPAIRHLNKRRHKIRKGMSVAYKHYGKILAGIGFLLLLYLLLVLFPIGNLTLSKTDVRELDAKVGKDIRYVQELIESAERKSMDIQDSGLFDISINDSNPDRTALLKEQFADLVDHIIHLDRFIEEYKYFYQINRLRHPELNEKAFLIAYSSYIAKYKILHELTASVGSNDYVEKLLNEELPDLGRGGLYYELKKCFTAPGSIIRINTGRAYLEYIDVDSPLVAYSKASYDEMFDGADHSIEIGLGSLMDRLEVNTMERWLPIQKRVANSLGETRLTQRHEYFITDEQIEKLYEIMEPGDIMFQRRNWYVSNAGMPGFWTHAAMYLGPMDKLEQHFSEEAFELYGMGLGQYVKEHYPDVYETMHSVDKKGNYRKTIEGKAEGVVMLSMEESAKADYLGVVRPKLSKEDKLKAIIFALSQHKKPYDYDFDFATDDSFVCSELVYKAYVPTGKKDGLRYDLGTIAGRYMLAPNDMVRAFDRNYGTEMEQNTFVLFLDGNEAEQKAFEKGVEEFRASWQRPKYDFMLE